ncbi:FAD-binding oxidoreductase [Burkholderia sp. Bp9090]|uniref:NAD(P)/FAD-dependent oxidoreductase n=1 Tax=Burkholderia sp. Bp9090 TaxID=2184567 RepID=UPI000F5EBEF3|nr:FAD-binding oxidoreductase [Burkholderia sp. Bp9090]RQZ24336.1 FAD-binding oxidoreductase [Burkholderia sp. Bp9090]
MKTDSSTDILVIGGGVSGMSVAYGLERAGRRVIVLDQGDDVFRATRGNFGLVWVQGKGVTEPRYARLSVTSAAQWPEFAAELTRQSGVNVQLSQVGGMRLSFSENELTRWAADMDRVRDSLGSSYPYELLNADEVRAHIPEVGPDVAGAIFSPLDGHVSPLRLLRALVQGFSNLGGKLITGENVEAIDCRGGEFHVRTQKGRYAASRIVLAAGLGNRVLAPMVGMHAPVEPVRGQILVTERMQPFLRYPTLHVRQTGEGVIQIGDSKEDVGFNDATTVKELGRIARNAVRYFPLLKTVNVVRAWGALRVMTPDGYPIYDVSQECPGAYLVTCHSGITLAAHHAGAISDWICGAEAPADVQYFRANRFHVQTSTN